jgi:hypothetical protein
VGERRPYRRTADIVLSGPAGDGRTAFPLTRHVTLFPIGVILLLCVVTYVIPSTSRLGAILLTGYLGGAVATHVRVRH